MLTVEPLVPILTIPLLCILALALPVSAGAAQDRHPVETLKACREAGDIGDASIIEKAGRLPSLGLQSIMALLNKDQGLCTLPNDCGNLEICLKAANNFYTKLGLATASSGTDDWKKLKADAQIAVGIYSNATARERVSYDDPQNHTTADFYLRTGGAQFNPNSSQTAALKRSIYLLLENRNTTQTELIHEALLATEGNLPLAFGSLAKIFHDDRAGLIPRVDGMTDDSAKNYYRFAGAFIGLQSGPVRLLGEIGSYGNMAGNPIVYAAAEVIGFWRDTFTGKSNGGVNTIRTVASRGMVAPKSRQLRMGVEAMLELKGVNKKTAQGFKSTIADNRGQPTTIRRAIDVGETNRRIHNVTHQRP